MNRKHVAVCGALSAIGLGWMALAQPNPRAGQNSGQARLYNTAKQKLMEGKQIFGITVSSPDPNIYCAVANAGYDFTWIEMQHSPLSW